MTVAVRVERKDNAIYFRLYSSSFILFFRSRRTAGRGEAAKILRVFVLFLSLFLFRCPPSLFTRIAISDADTLVDEDILICAQYAVYETLLRAIDLEVTLSDRA